MFVLSEIKDIAAVPPSELNRTPRIAVSDLIEAKYVGRVFHNVGLCIALFDLLETGESEIQHTTGNACLKINFRLIVFKPFVGEVIIAKIMESTRDYIRLSLGFFNHVLVYPKYLPQPSKFDENDQVWVWNYCDSELFLDVGEPVRVLVREVNFKQCHDASEHPLTIIGDISTQGLGPIDWWKDLV